MYSLSLCTVGHVQQLVVCLYVLICHWWYPHDNIHLSLQWGCTALVNASKAVQVECVKLLLNAGVQVNVQNEVSAVLFN